jgi:hypothetical protein
MEIALERFGADHRSVGIRIWRRDDGRVAYREIEVRMWDRICYVSIKMRPRST